MAGSSCRVQTRSCVCCVCGNLLANSARYSSLHAGVKALLREVETIIESDHGAMHWTEHELAPVRSSLVHVEWLLGGGLEQHET